MGRVGEWVPRTEGRADAKALKCDYGWCVGGTKEVSRSEQNETGRR